MMTPFLTARWSNLCLVTYEVEPLLLQSRLPAELELDTRDGMAFVSLVAFDFLDTRVMGIPWPGYRDFPEINLRFYVRHADRRGVMFVREFVPQTIVACLARRLYNEPYASTPMNSWVDRDAGRTTVEHRWRWKGEPQRLVVEAAGDRHLADEDSTSHFFKEHQWGFGIGHDGDTLVYEVRHPVWETYPVEDTLVDVDFGHLYGSEFTALNTTEPYSVVLAAGSEISVHPKRTLDDPA